MMILLWNTSSWITTISGKRIFFFSFEQENHLRKSDLSIPLLQHTQMTSSNHIRKSHICIPQPSSSFVGEEFGGHIPAYPHDSPPLLFLISPLHVYDYVSLLSQVTYTGNSDFRSLSFPLFIPHFSHRDNLLPFGKRLYLPGEVPLLSFSSSFWQFVSVCIFLKQRGLFSPNSFSHSCPSSCSPPPLSFAVHLSLSTSGLFREDTTKTTTKKKVREREAGVPSLFNLLYVLPQLLVVLISLVFVLENESRPLFLLCDCVK